MSDRIYFATGEACAKATSEAARITSPDAFRSKCYALTKAGERQKRCEACGRYKFDSERCNLFKWSPRRRESKYSAPNRDSAQ